MIQWLNEKWFKNKDKLENYFRTHKQEEYSSYQDILRATIENIINIDDYEWLNKTLDLSKIHVIDDGDYQGTLIFLIPRDGYQPDEDCYLVTFVNYGSCSGCDTLLNIQESWDIKNDEEYMGLPNTTQLHDYMTLALHLIENARWLENLWGAKNENN